MHILLTAWLVVTAVAASLFVLAVIGQALYLRVAPRLARAMPTQVSAPATSPSRVGAGLTA